MSIFSLFRRGIFAILIVCVIISLVWLYKHPEYYTYNAENILITNNGTVLYFKSNCLNFNTFGCDGKFTNPPPAYYILKKWNEIKPFFLIFTVMYLTFVIFKYRKELKEIIKGLE